MGKKGKKWENYSHMKEFNLKILSQIVNIEIAKLITELTMLMKLDNTLKYLIKLEFIRHSMKIMFFFNQFMFFNININWKRDNK